jgi:hypothetical protein
MSWRQVEGADLVEVATRDFMSERGHESPPRYSFYIHVDGELIGIAVESIGRVAELIRLYPQHIELVCGEHEDSVQLRRDLQALERAGALKPCVPYRAPSPRMPASVCYFGSKSRPSTTVWCL